MSTDNGSSIPKSMRHKRILDVAAEKPDASLEAIASEVPSASPELVERVLKEYGDPADDGKSDDENSTDGSTGDTDDGPPEEPSAAETPAEETPDGAGPDSGAVAPTPEALTSKQRETLAVVADRPDATQREVADRLGVSAATVSKRVNSIEGFEWSDRASLVDAVFDEQPSTPVTTDGGSTPEAGGDTASGESDGASPSTDADSSTTDVDAALERLESRVTDLETARTPDPTEGSVLEDPDLVHKVVHACMESDTISEEEELRILRALLA